MASIVRQGKAKPIPDMLNYFSGISEYQWRHSKYLTPAQKTVAATGVSHQTLHIRTYGISSPKKTGPKRKRIQDEVDNFDRTEIRRIIQEMYSQNTWPNVQKVYEKVKADTGFQGSERTLLNILRHGIHIQKKRSNSLQHIERAPRLGCKTSFLLIKNERH